MIVIWVQKVWEMGAFREFINKIPVPVCGLALALASLDLFLIQQYEFYTVSVCALISVVLLALFTLKAVLNFNGLKTELDSPIVFGVLPTYCMTFMILSFHAHEYIGQAAVGIWVFAVVLNFVMMFFFAKKYVLKFNMKNIFPSWFVMFIGFAAASITAPLFNIEVVGKVLLYAALAAYIIITPLILYRLMKVKLPDPAVPNIAIFAAPMNLCLVAFFAEFGFGVSETTIMAMGAIGVASYVAVLLYMPTLLKAKFYPSYSAFTFPLVIGVVSIQRLGIYYNISESSIFSVIMAVTLIIAVAMVAYVLIRYIVMFYGYARGPGEDAKA